MIVKMWTGTTMAFGGIDARHRDGRRVSQVTAAVRETSQRRAAEAVHQLLDGLRDYFHCWEDNEPTFVPSVIRLLPLGTVLVRSMDPGGTVNGRHGWVVVR